MKAMITAAAKCSERDIVNGLFCWSRCSNSVLPTRPIDSVLRRFKSIAEIVHLGRAARRVKVSTIFGIALGGNVL
jgi:hypothetical protein